LRVALADRRRVAGLLRGSSSRSCLLVRGAEAPFVGPAIARPGSLPPEQGERIGAGGARRRPVRDRRHEEGDRHRYREVASGSKAVAWKSRLRRRARNGQRQARTKPTVTRPTDERSTADDVTRLGSQGPAAPRARAPLGHAEADQPEEPDGREHESDGREEREGPGAELPARLRARHHGVHSRDPVDHDLRVEPAGLGWMAVDGRSTGSTPARQRTPAAGVALRVVDRPAQRPRWTRWRRDQARQPYAGRSGGMPCDDVVGARTARG
jgi:hypothetical protein